MSNNPTCQEPTQTTQTESAVETEISRYRRRAIEAFKAIDEVLTQTEPVVETENNRCRRTLEVAEEEEHYDAILRGKIYTTCGAITYIALTLGLYVYMYTYFVVNMKCDGGGDALYYYFYFQPIHYCLTSLFEIYCRKKHEQSWREGFLKFNRQIIPYWRMLFLLTATNNCMALLVLSIFMLPSDYCKSNVLVILLPLMGFPYILIAIAIVIVYIVKIRRFNSCFNVPNTLDHTFIRRFTKDNYQWEIENTYDRKYSVKVLLEWQAELIHFLMTKNQLLDEKISLLEK